MNRIFEGVGRSEIEFAGRVYMTVDTNTMVSITEANQNVSKVARLVDGLGSVVILKNNAPKYLVIDFSKNCMKWFSQ